jgi:hypothetical protein
MRGPFLEADEGKGQGRGLGAQFIWRECVCCGGCGHLTFSEVPFNMFYAVGTGMFRHLATPLLASMALAAGIPACAGHLGGDSWHVANSVRQLAALPHSGLTLWPDFAPALAPSRQRAR